MKKNKKINRNFVIGLLVTIFLIVFGCLLIGLSFINGVNNFSNGSIIMMIFGVIFIFGSVFSGVYCSGNKK